MSKDSLEHISSLMDGELSHETSLFVARRMGSDEELGKTWSRFHLVRECLRRPGGKWALTGMSLDLEGLDFELAENPAAKGVVPTWLKPVSGFAIAASVAVVAILVALPGAVEEMERGGPLAQPFTSPNPLSAAPASQPASYNGAQRAANTRLNSYLLRHNQVAGSAGLQGFVSFVPIVTSAPVQVMDSDEAQEVGKQSESGPDDQIQP